MIQGLAGRVWVDDEDEFAHNRVRWGYPAAVVAAAVASCRWVEAAVRATEAPFDGSHRAWLAQLADLRRHQGSQ